MMELTRKILVSVMLTAGMLLTVLVILNGCEKTEPTTTEPATNTMNQEMAQQKPDTEGTMQVATTTEQTMCPIMNAPIDKNIFVEYEGKKVYFCCKGCETKFKENPEEYIAKLPQFKK